jgi:hypothetical protein
MVSVSIVQDYEISRTGEDHETNVFVAFNGIKLSFADDMKAKAELLQSCKKLQLRDARKHEMMHFIGLFPRDLARADDSPEKPRVDCATTDAWDIFWGEVVKGRRGMGLGCSIRFTLEPTTG